MAEEKKSKDTQSSPNNNSFGIEKEINDKDLKGKSYGEILLYQREAIFDKIFRSEKLNSIIIYFLLWSILFSSIFGFILGFYALNLQIIAGAIKVPFLIWGSVVICLPALFTFNVLLGSKLSFKQTTAVLSITAYLISTVAVSLSPIMLFFIVCGSSKSFVILLTVIAFSISGSFGVSLLWNAMGYLTKRANYPYNAGIIKSWTLIYAFVGTQLAWIMRPFVGDKGDFALFRNIEGNFYIGLFDIIKDFF